MSSSISGVIVKHLVTFSVASRKWIDQHSRIFFVFDLSADICFLWDTEMFLRWLCFEKIWIKKTHCCLSIRSMSTRIDGLENEKVKWDSVSFLNKVSGVCIVPLTEFVKLDCVGNQPMNTFNSYPLVAWPWRGHVRWALGNSFWRVTLNSPPPLPWKKGWSDPPLLSSGKQIVTRWQHWDSIACAYYPLA